MNSPCPICLDLNVGSDICLTPCGHVFHSKCIFRWIDSSEACPECRRNLTKNNIIHLHANANDIYAKKGEAVFSKLSLAKAKIKDLQEHLAKKEEEHAAIREKYLVTESKLDETKLDLRRGILETFNLIQENDSLVRQLSWFKPVAIKILETISDEGLKGGISSVS